MGSLVLGLHGTAARGEDGMRQRKWEHHRRRLVAADSGDFHARHAQRSVTESQCLETLPLPWLYGSLPHNGQAADMPALLSSLSSPQGKQQEQQHVSLLPWQMLLSSAAAAHQGGRSLPTVNGCRTKGTAATAGGSASSAKPARGQAKGQSTGTGATSGGSSSPVQPCPLHACLLQNGITDLAAFSARKHLALSQEAVSSSVEPKLAALAAEGLSPKQVARILAAHDSPLSCNYADTFLPNLQLLRQIGAHSDHRPHPKAPHLTAAGKILTDAPDAAAQYLSRDPGKVQQLLQWLEGSLGVGLKELAACKTLCNALRLSAGAASAVCLSLQKQQVPAEQVAHMLLRQPTSFSLKPEVLSARLGAVQQHLGLDAAAALQVAIAQPNTLAIKLESSLPALLRFLDGCMGEEGAGRRLVRGQPVIVVLAAKRAERSVANLAARGYSQQQIQAMISKQPTLLNLDLDSPLQRQKLDWIERVSPWTVDDFMVTPRYSGTRTRRLAARLALLRECRLPPPSTPGVLAVSSDSCFMMSVQSQVAREGRELPWAG
ncbi:hypothetical protein N2152v2_009957 [Parachlorella kessleri]